MQKHDDKLMQLEDLWCLCECVYLFRVNICNGEPQQRVSHIPNISLSCHHCFWFCHCRSHNIPSRRPSSLTYYAAKEPAAYPGHLLLVFDNNVKKYSKCVFKLRRINSETSKLIDNKNLVSSFWWLYYLLFIKLLNYQN